MTEPMKPVAYGCIQESEYGNPPCKQWCGSTGCLASFDKPPVFQTAKKETPKYVTIENILYIRTDQLAERDRVIVLATMHHIGQQVNVEVYAKICAIDPDQILKDMKL